jgi:hypothetical protein
LAFRLAGQRWKAKSLTPPQSSPSPSAKGRESPERPDAARRTNEFAGLRGFRRPEFPALQHKRKISTR